MLHHPGKSDRVINRAGEAEQRKRAFELQRVARKPAQNCRDAKAEEAQHQHFGFADAVGEPARQRRSKAHHHRADCP